MPFQFRLAAVLRLRRARESESQLKLAAALAGWRAAVATQAGLQRRHAASRAAHVQRLRSGRATPEDFMREGLFHSRLASEIESAGRDVEARQADVQFRRADLAHAAREREALERLKDKHRVRFRRKQDRKDARLADELYLARYGRRDTLEPALVGADEDAFA